MKTTSNILTCVAVGGLAACAMERAPAAATDTRPCVANYSTQGEFWTGKKFKTFEDFRTGSRTVMFDKVAAAIASKGFQIISSNKDLGIISASQGVSYGQGKNVPLNAVVTNK